MMDWIVLVLLLLWVVVCWMVWVDGGFFPPFDESILLPISSRQIDKSISIADFSRQIIDSACPHSIFDIRYHIDHGDDETTSPTARPSSFLPHRCDHIVDLCFLSDILFRNE